MIKLFNFIKKTPPGGVVVSMIFGIENHGNSSHYDLHIENFNSCELKFSIEYQYKTPPSDVQLVGRLTVGIFMFSSLEPLISFSEKNILDNAHRKLIQNREGLQQVTSVTYFAMTVLLFVHVSFRETAPSINTFRMYSWASGRFCTSGTGRRRPDWSALPS